MFHLRQPAQQNWNRSRLAFEVSGKLLTPPRSCNDHLGWSKGLGMAMSGWQLEFGWPSFWSKSYIIYGIRVKQLPQLLALNSVSWKHHLSGLFKCWSALYIRVYPTSERMGWGWSMAILLGLIPPWRRSQGATSFGWSWRQVPKGAPVGLLGSVDVGYGQSATLLLLSWSPVFF